jgi:hypothetical protein
MGCVYVCVYTCTHIHPHPDACIYMNSPFCLMNGLQTEGREKQDAMQGFEPRTPPAYRRTMTHLVKSADLANPALSAAAHSPDLPTCAVCMEKLGSYGGPSSLPCGHNGCLQCLQKVGPCFRPAIFLILSGDLVYGLVLYPTHHKHIHKYLLPIHQNTGGPESYI